MKKKQYFIIFYTLIYVLRMYKAYKKLFKITDVLMFFNFTWTIHNENIMHLWNTLSDYDKKIFPFNITILNDEQHKDYCSNAYIGLRKYIVKEDLSKETMKKVLIRAKR